MDLRISSFSEPIVPSFLGEGGRIRAPSIAWLILAAVAVGLLGLIVGAPLLQSSSHSELAASIYRAFSYVCHQLPERSLHLAGQKFAVCSRCTGIYAGFAITVLAYPLVRPLNRTETPARLWLILATVPLAIDFALGYFSIWENTHLSRFLTGALLSSVAVFYIMPGVSELSSALARRLLKAS